MAIAKGHTVLCQQSQHGVTAQEKQETHASTRNVPPGPSGPKPQAWTSSEAMTVTLESRENFPAAVLPQVPGSPASSPGFWGRPPFPSGRDPGEPCPAQRGGPASCGHRACEPAAGDQAGWRVRPWCGASAFPHRRVPPSPTPPAARAFASSAFVSCCQNVVCPSSLGALEGTAFNSFSPGNKVLLLPGVTGLDSWKLMWMTVAQAVLKCGPDVRGLKRRHRRAGHLSRKNKNKSIPRRACAHVCFVHGPSPGPGPGQPPRRPRPRGTASQEHGSHKARPGQPPRRTLGPGAGPRDVTVSASLTEGLLPSSP